MLAVIKKTNIKISLFHEHEHRRSILHISSGNWNCAQFWQKEPVFPLPTTIIGNSECKGILHLVPIFNMACTRELLFFLCPISFFLFPHLEFTPNVNLIIKVLIIIYNNKKKKEGCRRSNHAWLGHKCEFELVTFFSVPQLFSLWNRTNNKPVQMQDLSKLVLAYQDIYFYLICKKSY